MSLDFLIVELHRNVHKPRFVGEWIDLTQDLQAPLFADFWLVQLITHGILLSGYLSYIRQ
jgi:hypothetical protein